MKTTHTPGPWNVNVPPHKFPIYAKHEANRFCYVAVTPRDDGISDEQRDANARLIAAAPELLAVLEESAEVLAGSPSPEAIETVLAMIHSAIAKATA